MPKISSRIILLFILFIYISAPAQILTGVNKWIYKSTTTGKEATLLMKADVNEGWHIYSQNIAADGPIPTAFTFKPSSQYKLIGKTMEPHAEEYFDPQFAMKIRFFDKDVEFSQKIEILTDKVFKVKGSVEFMACNDKQCLPPTDSEFEITVIPDPAVIVKKINLSSLFHRNQC